MRKFVFMFFLLIFTGSSFAQPMRGGDQRDRKMHDRMQTIKILKITEELELTEEQSVKFFPRYKKLEKEIIGIDKKLDDLTRLMVEEINNVKSEKEIKDLMTQFYELDNQKYEKHKEMMTSFKDILTVQQQALLITFEHRFPMMMRDMIREMRGEGGHPYAPGQGRGRPNHDQFDPNEEIRGR